MSKALCRRDYDLILNLSVPNICFRKSVKFKKEKLMKKNDIEIVESPFSIDFVARFLVSLSFQGMSLSSFANQISFQ